MNPLNERGPRRKPRALDSTLIAPTTDQSNRHQEITKVRFAEDADRLLAEVFAFMDAADRLLCAALLDGDDLAGAAEHSIICHGRARRFLDLLLVREVVSV